MNTLLAEANSLISKEDKWYTKLANASSLLNQHINNINWVGFYILEGDYLYLGPFIGKPACTKIKVGKGVCGTCIKNDSTIIVPNVHEFEGHIACDSASNSEIVVPLHKDGKVVGVLDIDSPSLNRFNEDDKAGLELFAKTLEEVIDFSTVSFE